MEELSFQQSEWYRELQLGKTKVTVHNVNICSKINDVMYITTAVGTVSNVSTELDDRYGVLSLTLEICIFPYAKHIRNYLPQFKNMIPDPDNNTRTIFKDDHGSVHVRIMHEIAADDELYTDSLNIPGVFVGVKCRDNCYRKCFKHGITQPYSYQRV